MTNKIEVMMNDIIRKFGLEDIHTIIFCGMVERNTSMGSLWDTYDEYMSLDVMLDEYSSIIPKEIK